MREYWTWLWPAASKPSNTLRGFFLDACGINPTGYRQDFLGSKAASASETRDEDASISMVAF
jgi:hypothetical protein